MGLQQEHTIKKANADLNTNLVGKNNVPEDSSSTELDPEWKNGKTDLILNVQQLIHFQLLQAEVKGTLSETQKDIRRAHSPIPPNLSVWIKIPSKVQIFSRNVNIDCQKRRTPATGLARRVK